MCPAAASSSPTTREAAAAATYGSGKSPEWHSDRVIALSDEVALIGIGCQHVEVRCKQFHQPAPLRRAAGVRVQAYDAGTRTGFTTERFGYRHVVGLLGLQCCSDAMRIRRSNATGRRGALMPADEPRCKELHKRRMQSNACELG